MVSRAVNTSTGMAAGQHQIQHDQVERARRGAEPFLAVAGECDLVPLGLEPFLDRAGHLHFVLDDENGRDRHGVKDRPGRGATRMKICSGQCGGRNSAADFRRFSQVRAPSLSPAVESRRSVEVPAPTYALTLRPSCARANAIGVNLRESVAG
jgi:hypothetical protein